MKKLILPSLILALFSSFSNADYMVQYGLEKSNGTNIKFITSPITTPPVTPSGNWISAEPLISDWTNVGPVSGCSNWSPLENTVDSGLSFKQTATNCQQNQTRTVQNREQNDYSKVYRNIGNLITESKTLNNQSSERFSTGTKTLDECSYVYGSTTTMSAWIDNSANKTYDIWWQGSKLYSGSPSVTTTTYTISGFKYVRTGNYINTAPRSADSYYYYYKICRTPV